MLRKPTAGIIIAVFVPPKANVNEAMDELYNNISILQMPSTLWQGTSTRKISGLFYQHIDFPMSGSNTSKCSLTSKSRTEQLHSSMLATQIT